jgi:hypothetical protein
MSIQNECGFPARRHPDPAGPPGLAGPALGPPARLACPAGPDGERVVASA